MYKKKMAENEKANTKVMNTSWLWARNKQRNLEWRQLMRKMKKKKVNRKKKKKHIQKMEKDF